MNQPLQQLTSHFGDYLSESKETDWLSLRLSLPVGTQVFGTVVFRNNFAVFVDIGYGYPGISLATSMRPFPEGPNALPDIGRTIAASVARFADQDRLIVLQQTSTL